MGKTKVVALGTLVGVALALAPLSSAFADSRFDRHWGHGSSWGGPWQRAVTRFAAVTVAAAACGRSALRLRPSGRSLPRSSTPPLRSSPCRSSLSTCRERGVLRVARGLWAAGRHVRRRDTAFLLQQRGACLLRAARALLQQCARSGLLRSARSAGLLQRCPRVLRAARALLRSAPAVLRSACTVLRSACGSGGTGLRLRSAAGLLQPGSACSRLLRLSALTASADEAIGRGRFDTASSNQESGVRCACRRTAADLPTCHGRRPRRSPFAAAGGTARRADSSTLPRICSCRTATAPRASKRSRDAPEFPSARSTIASPTSPRFSSPSSIASSIACVRPPMSSGSWATFRRSCSGSPGFILRAALLPQALALNRMLVAESARFPKLAAVVTERGVTDEAIRVIAGILEREIRAGKPRLGQPDVRGPAVSLHDHRAAAAPGHGLRRADDLRRDRCLGGRRRESVPEWLSRLGARGALSDEQNWSALRRPRH